jgi:hypothetical protein
MQIDISIIFIERIIMKSICLTNPTIALFFALALVISAVSAANATYVVAQSDVVQHQSQVLNKQSVIVIEVEGNVNITSWKEQYATTAIATERTGNIYGWSNDKERPKYDVALKQRGDTLFIQPQARPELWVVGIATVNENIVQTFFLPNTAKVVVRSRNAAIHVQGMFTGLEAMCAKGSIKAQVLENQVHFLQIYASSITVNQAPLSEQRYSLENKGSALYRLESAKGTVEVMLTQ